MGTDIYDMPPQPWGSHSHGEVTALGSPQLGDDTPQVPSTMGRLQPPGSLSQGMGTDAKSSQPWGSDNPQRPCGRGEVTDLGLHIYQMVTSPGSPPPRGGDRPPSAPPGPLGSDSRRAPGR